MNGKGLGRVTPGPADQASSLRSAGLCITNRSLIRVTTFPCRRKLPS